MATLTSTGTGNWGTIATWDEGSRIPEAGDDVIIANGHTVTMDETRTPAVGTLASITGAGTGSLTIAGGAGKSIHAEEITALGVDLLEVTGASVLAITGNINGGVTAGAGAHYAVHNKGSTAISIIGNVVGGSVSANSRTIRCDVTCTLNITGDIVGDNSSMVVLVYGSTTTTVTGNVTGGDSTSAVGLYLGAGSQAVTITETLAGGTGALANGIYSLSTGNTLTVGTLAVTGDSAPAFGGIAPTVTYDQITVDGVQVKSGVGGRLGGGARGGN